jgi:hypothetical protein
MGDLATVSFSVEHGQGWINDEVCQMYHIKIMGKTQYFVYQPAPSKFVSKVVMRALSDMGPGVNS